jgi:hypothetical protein
VPAPTKTSGTCFGFAVSSSLPFHYLRSGEGEPLAISAPSHVPEDGMGELVIEWTPTPTLPFAAVLYREGTRFLLSMGTAGWFVIDPDEPSIVLPDDPDGVRREERLWNLPVTLCLIARGYLPLHAAAIEVDGEALVFGAPRTFGKTTLAAAFVSAGYRLLSEDLTCLRIGEKVDVLPGPAMLRVRPDVAERLDIKRATRLGEDDDRVHFAIDEAERGDGSPVPLRGIVLLRADDAGHRLEPVPATEAVRDLWPLTFGLPTAEDRGRAFAGLVDLVRSFPVSNLHRPARFEELPATVEYLVERV